VKKKIIIGFAAGTFVSSMFGAQLSTYHQLNFKKLNPGFSVYSKPAPKGWDEVVIKEKHAKATPNQQEQQLGFIAYQRPATEPVFPKSFPAPDEKVDKLSAFAAPGETEPLTLSVYALKKLEKLQVTISALKSSSGIIRSADIEQRVVTYWTTRYPRYTTDGCYIYTPELLMPTAALTFPAGFSFRYWFIIHPPEQASPGLYHGVVTLKLNGKTVRKLPVSYQVLNIRLLKDPDKHFSAYAYNRHSTYERAKFAKNFINKPKRYRAIRLNEYKKMKEYGFDMYPSIYPGFDAAHDKIILDIDELKLMRQAGLNGPVFLFLGGVINALQRKFFNHSAGSHCRQLEISSAFLERLKQVVARLEETRKKNRLPVFIYGVLDEVAPLKAAAAARVYAKIKELKVPTQTTKDFNVADAGAYHKYVDYWCSGGFSVSYKTATTSDKYQFWCYPNDIAGQEKDARIMGKGGRFTYGFGLWRSGFTTLVPWHWRWQVGDAFDYCRGRRGGTGNRIDPQGIFLPTYYWENFREGYDDGRYLYTLQQAIVERRGSTNPACRKVVREAELYLQALWNAIPNREKYLHGNFWLGQRFNLTRWQIALYIMALQKYPAVDKISAGSVTVKTTSKVAKEKVKFVCDELKMQDIAGWRNITVEGKLAMSKKLRDNGKPVIKWQVTIDKEHDGGGESSGKYLVGWPRIYRAIKTGSIDLRKYDFFSMKVYIASDRDAVQAEQSPLHYDFIFSKPGGKTIKVQGYILKTVSENRWVQVRLNIKDILGSQKVDLKNFSGMQIWLGERSYPDKATIKFYFADMAFLKFQNPVINTVNYLPDFTIGTGFYPVEYGILGISTVKSGSFTVRAELVDSSGKTVASGEIDVTAGKELRMPVKKQATPGRGKLMISVVSQSGKVVAEKKQTVNFIQPFPI
jgi:hypothetical protein